VTRSRLSRRLIGRTSSAVCLAALAGTAAACQPVHSGAALVIGDERVTVSEIQSKVTEVNKEREKAGQQVQLASSVTQGQLQQIIAGHIVDRAAEQVGASVSQAEVDAQRRLLEQRAGGPDAFAKQVAGANIVPGELDEFLRHLILSQKVGEKLVPTVTTAEQQQERDTRVNELFTRVGRELGIKVNPRYGTWNPAEFNIAPTFPGFIKPEHDETPTPSP
jgi:hypothetical protein